MGLIASLVMERRQSDGWKTIGDLLYPFEMRRPAKGKKPKKEPIKELCYHAMPHNRLVVAHLLGAFNTQSVGDAPDCFPDDLRIAGKHRGIPEDADPTTKAAMGARSHMAGPDSVPSWCTLQEILAFDWIQPITHRFWVNGPMTLQWHRKDFSAMPERVATYHHTQDAAPMADAIVVELDELQDLAEKCLGHGTIEEQEARMNRWAECRWAYVERDYPLLSLCDDFIGCVVGQLLDGKPPQDARVICWVS